MNVAKWCRILSSWGRQLPVGEVNTGLGWEDWNQFLCRWVILRPPEVCFGGEASVPAFVKPGRWKSSPTYFSSLHWGSAEVTDRRAGCPSIALQTLPWGVRESKPRLGNGQDGEEKYLTWKAKKEWLCFLSVRKALRVTLSPFMLVAPETPFKLMTHSWMDPMALVSNSHNKQYHHRICPPPVFCASYFWLNSCLKRRWILKTVWVTVELACTARCIPFPSGNSFPLLEKVPLPCFYRWFCWWLCVCVYFWVLFCLAFGFWMSCYVFILPLCSKAMFAGYKRCCLPHCLLAHIASKEKFTDICSTLCGTSPPPPLP